MKKYRTGLVVGKFSPLHVGHEYVINTAIAQCERVVILSYSSPEFKRCEAAERRRWLTTLFPTCTVLVIEPGVFRLTANSTIDVPDNDAVPYDHREFCAEVLLKHLHTSVDAVFTSEEYGDWFADHLTEYFHDKIKTTHSVVHVSVDQNRSKFPVSGTMLRANQTSSHLSDVVRSSFIKRVAILGGESSGKTVLSQALAAQLQTKWMPEYGREFCQTVGGVHLLRYEDMYHIAQVQVEYEQQVGEEMLIGKPLICDTTPLTTAWYSIQLFGLVDPRLLALAKRQYDFYVLCAPSFPFVQDGTRKDDQFRREAHEWYVQVLTKTNIPFIVVTGSVAERVQQVTHYIGEVK